jgi:hypothetical protein
LRRRRSRRWQARTKAPSSGPPPPAHRRRAHRPEPTAAGPPPPAHRRRARPDLIGDLQVCITTLCRRLRLRLHRGLSVPRHTAGDLDAPGSSRVGSIGCHPAFMHMTRSSRQIAQRQAARRLRGTPTRAFTAAWHRAPGDVVPDTQHNAGSASAVASRTRVWVSDGDRWQRPLAEGCCRIATRPTGRRRWFEGPESRVVSSAPPAGVQLGRSIGPR